MSILENISQVKENKKILFSAGILILLLVCAGVWYFMFYQPNNIYETENIEQTDVAYTQDELQGQNNTQNISGEENTAENNTQDFNLNNQDNLAQNNINNFGIGNDANMQQEEINTMEYNTAIANNNLHTDTISQLAYSIKPLDKKIAFCDIMHNGKWNMIKSCEDSMFSSINELLNTNKEIVALEVVGVVDSNPYAGPSAELKQEGLASFRAREAIKAITAEFSNIAVFEGLSMQTPNKRGFEIKAYYLQK